MSKKNPSPEELRLWHAQLKGVKPLSKMMTIPKEFSLPTKTSPQSTQRPLEIKKGPPIAPSPLQNFGRKQLRHLAIDGRLDLHGMSLEKGYDALTQFLIRAQERGDKVVLIITGKGAIGSENTLRHQLPLWIKERPVRHLISEFHAPAKPQDGGQGACYIGLRNVEFLPITRSQL